MSEYKRPYLNRSVVVRDLEDRLNKHARIPVDSGENAGYNLGHSLGYSDGLRDAISYLKQHDGEDKPERSNHAWHHST